MTQGHSNTTKRTFTHLTEIERGQIAAYLDEGLSIREIGRRMDGCQYDFPRKETWSCPAIRYYRKAYTKYFPDVGAQVYERNRENCGAIPLLWRHGSL